MLSSNSNGLEFWSVNHTSKHKNPELNDFINNFFLGEVSSNCPNDLLEINANKTLDSCW